MWDGFYNRGLIDRVIIKSATSIYWCFLWAVSFSSKWNYWFWTSSNQWFENLNYWFGFFSFKICFPHLTNHHLLTGLPVNSWKSSPPISRYLAVGPPIALAPFIENCVFFYLNRPPPDLKLKTLSNKCRIQYNR